MNKYQKEQKKKQDQKKVEKRMERHKINSKLKHIAESKDEDELDDTIEIYKKVEGGEWEKIRIKRLKKS